MDHPPKPEHESLDARAQRSATQTAVVAFACLIGLTALTMRVTMPQTPWRAIWLLAGPIWGSWLLVSPVLVRLTLVVGRWRGRRLAGVAAHLAALLAVQMAQSFISVLVVGAMAPDGGRPEVTLLGLLLHQRLPLTALVYCALVGLTWSAGVWWHLRDERLRLEQVERQAIQARLAALSARLRPHVLFNTLHATGVLLDRDPARGRAMMTALGDVMRDLLDEAAPADVTLADEVALLDRYLAIERVRFADRLHVTIELEEGTGGCMVPRLLLQPIVENAIHHGLAHRDGGQVRITARRDGERLLVVVWNSGASVQGTPREGTGLGTTRERLRLHAPSATVTLSSPPQGGTDVVITLPFQRQPSRDRTR